MTTEAAGPVWARELPVALFPFLDLPQVLCFLPLPHGIRTGWEMLVSLSSVCWRRWQGGSFPSDMEHFSSSWMQKDLTEQMNGKDPLITLAVYSQISNNAVSKTIKNKLHIALVVQLPTRCWDQPWSCCSSSMFMIEHKVQDKFQCEDLWDSHKGIQFYTKASALVQVFSCKNWCC